MVYCNGPTAKTYQSFLSLRADLEQGVSLTAAGFSILIPHTNPDHPARGRERAVPRHLAINLISVFLPWRPPRRRGA